MTATHLMLDIETLGKRPGCVVLCAALVRFSDYASVQLNFSIPDQTALGMHQDASTLEWWGTLHAQDPGAWPAATVNPYSLVVGLQYLGQWIAAAGPDPLIWCHGATFDAPLLGEAYRLAGVPCPWAYTGKCATPARSTTWPASIRRHPHISCRRRTSR